MEKYYVYKILDPKTQDYYIGSRGFYGNIEDDEYMGSPTSWDYRDKSRLKKIILKSDFRFREEAYRYEGQILENCINDPLCRNKNISRLNTEPLVLRVSNTKGGIYLNTKT